MPPVKITDIFYPEIRSDWRKWLIENHTSKSEIWVKRYRKATGITCISYDDLVEECLCFGWIDGVVKKLDDESYVQRITPRRKGKTFLSELNRQRVWKLQKEGLMNPASEQPIYDQIGSPSDPFEIPAWIEESLREDLEVWQRFKDFPFLYQRLKIGWIKETGNSKRRIPEAKKRLNYLIKMTRQDKRYGTEPLIDYY